jgi:hypothetical protein
LLISDEICILKRDSKNKRKEFSLSKENFVLLPDLSLPLLCSGKVILELMITESSMFYKNVHLRRKEEFV